MDMYKCNARRLFILTNASIGCPVYMCAQQPHRTYTVDVYMYMYCWMPLLVTAGSSVVSPSAAQG